MFVFISQHHRPMMSVSGQWQIVIAAEIFFAPQESCDQSEIGTGPKKHWPEDRGPHADVDHRQPQTARLALNSPEMEIRTNRTIHQRSDGTRRQHGPRRPAAPERPYSGTK